MKHAHAQEFQILHSFYLILRVQEILCILHPEDQTQATPITKGTHRASATLTRGIITLGSTFPKDYSALTHPTLYLTVRDDQPQTSAPPF